MKKRMISRALALFMALSLLSTTAFAASYSELNKAISSTTDGTFGENQDIYAATGEDGVRNVRLDGDVNRGENDSYINIAAGKEVTIDLNGHNIVDETTQSDATQTTYNIVVQGTLTVEGEGTIKSDNAQVITNDSSKSTLNLTGGTIEATGTGIAVNTEGTAIISEGVTVTSGKTGVKVTGGTLETAGNISGDRSGIVATGDSSVTVSGGSVEGGSTNGLYLERGATAIIDGADTTIKGGTTGIIIYDKGTALTVKDGAIQGGSYGISGNGQYHGTITTVLGGSITGGSTGIYHPQDGTLIIGSEANGTGPVITGVSGNGVQMCAGEGFIYGGTIQGSGNDTTADKTGDGVIPDGAAVSLVSRDGYGSANKHDVYSEPKVTIHTNHVKLINGEATYQWANTKNPGNMPEDWTGNTETSGIFEVTHHDDVENDQYYTDDFVVIDPRVEPTTTSTGLTEGSHCKVCGHVFVPQEPIPMLPDENPGTTEDPETPTDPGDVTIPDSNVPLADSPDAAATTIEDDEVPLAGLLTLADLLEELRQHEEIAEIELPEDFKWIDHELAQAIYWGLQEGLVVDTEKDPLDPDELLTVGLMREVLTNYVDIYMGLDDFVVELEGEDEDLVMDYVDMIARLGVFYEELEAALEAKAA